MKIINVKKPLNLDSPPWTLWTSAVALTVLIVLSVLSFATYFSVAFNAAAFYADAPAVSHGRDYTHRHRSHARDERNNVARILKYHFYILHVFFYIPIKPVRARG